LQERENIILEGGGYNSWTNVYIPAALKVNTLPFELPFFTFISSYPFLLTFYGSFPFSNITRWSTPSPIEAAYLQMLTTVDAHAQVNNMEFMRYNMINFPIALAVET
jgi:hypothetical protein